MSIAILAIMPLPIFIAVESLVIGGEQVEILIINDGSQDQTQETERLASRYPSIVETIYQENKGHGELRSISNWQRGFWTLF